MAKGSKKADCGMKRGGKIGSGAKKAGAGGGMARLHAQNNGGKK